MHRFLRPHIRVRQQGQTLIIALIVLGVLLILGLVFLGVINRNILNAARNQRRSEATDLATGGIAYAHSQLVSSPLGADWRGAPTVVAETAADVTGDPDVYYLRPGNLGSQPSGIVGDLGGPDGLGAYVRIPYPGGRALVRVRYGASDANPAPGAGGPLRNAGAARATLIIESVGRPGVVNANDPTTFNQTGGIKFKNFANAQDLGNALAQMAAASAQIPTSRRMVAFAPIGIIDAARFETNVFKSSAPIELGIADGLGAQAFNDVGTPNGRTDVGTFLPMQLGASGAVYRGPANQGRYGGSVIANGDLMLYGKVHAYLNRALGDGIRVAGRITGANGAELQITSTDFVGGNYTAPSTKTLTDGGVASFDSQDPSFDTASGLVLDGSQRTDLAGFTSGVGSLVPPSTLTVDPDTKLNRYVSMTRETGVNDAANGAVGGAFGHGAGVYVDNVSDRQEPADSEARRAVGSQRSLFDDWLNPNSGAADTGWQGPFYVPKGAVVQLLPDGFTIQRGGTNGEERFWKRPDGSNSGLSTIRYRLGLGLDKQVHVLDTLTYGGDINGAIAPAQFNSAIPFNGVLYFEGNVRVRGTIPTGVQMTLVSGATIYIDGSILKGTTNNDVFSGNGQDGQNAPRGQTITVPPTASLMLMARDNVAVNTTTFVGPTANQTLKSVNDVSGVTSFSPVRMEAAGGAEAGSLNLLAELPLNPTDAAGVPIKSPAQWLPYAMQYRSYDGGGFIPTQLLVSETMDDGTAAASFFAMNVNVGSGTDDATSYLFEKNDPIRNAYTAYVTNTPGTQVRVYGLGIEPWQRASRFETRAFSLIGSDATPTLSNTGQISGLGTGRPNLFSGANDILFRPASVSGIAANDTLFARAALAPGDVRIEASIFAEQGSFFIIPGPWFNPEPNDTHKSYEDRITYLQSADGGSLTAGDAVRRANRERLESYGTAPQVPFYGEPLDMRISIVGSVAENLPPPIAVQSEWVRKWGWIPRRIGGRTDDTGAKIGIPTQHLSSDFDRTLDNFVPNILIQYDPILATGRVNDSTNDPTLATPIRVDSVGRPLPPMPRLPVSPKLAYFGEL